MRCEVLLLAGLVVTSTIAHAIALPATAPGKGAQAKSRSDIEDARVYCYNRETGYFLHLGGGLPSSSPRLLP